MSIAEGIGAYIGALLMYGVLYYLFRRIFRGKESYEEAFGKKSKLLIHGLALVNAIATIMPAP